MADVVEVVGAGVGVGLVEDYQVLSLHFLIQLMLNEDMDPHTLKQLLNLFFEFFLIKN